jgi:DNA-directed RNA polymerase subunit RPC12/RpoP
VYACQYCGKVARLQPAKEHLCEKCRRKRWVKALNVQRIR